MDKNMTNQFFFVCICLLLLNGCSLFEEDVCTSISIPAITVQVESSEPAGYPAKDIFAIAKDGSYRDSVFVSSPGNFPLALAHDRAGHYQVTVGGFGFKTEQFQNVRVQTDSNDCHPETVNLIVELKPESIK
jgi:hypothetical protein